MEAKFKCKLTNRDTQEQEKWVKKDNDELFDEAQIWHANFAKEQHL